MKKVFISLLLVVSACAGGQGSKPLMLRSLVSTSDEKISFPISDSDSVNAIEKWISSGDAPSTAEISCDSKAKSCKKTKSLLKKHKIAFTEQAEGDAGANGNLALTYNRIAARDCGTAVFGCATSINSVKMITDRRQIIQPSLSDPQDAAGAVRAINRRVR